MKPADELVGPVALLKKLLAIFKSEDMRARVVAVENLPFFRRDIEPGEVSLEDVSIALFESHLVLQFSGDHFSLLANAAAQNEDPGEPGDRRENQRRHQVSRVLCGEPWNCREDLD